MFFFYMDHVLGVLLTCNMNQIQRLSAGGVTRWSQRCWQTLYQIDTTFKPKDFKSEALDEVIEELCYVRCTDVIQVERKGTTERASHSKPSSTS